MPYQKMKMMEIDWKKFEKRKNRIRMFAEELLQESNLLYAPVDIFSLLKSEYPLLKIRGGNFGTLFDGQLEYHPDKNRFILFYNTRYQASRDDNNDHPRIRFSIAHELGHYYLDDHREYLLNGGESHQSKDEFNCNNLIEKEADCFAASLLAPKKLLSPLVNKGELSFSIIRETAETLQVSIVSTAISAVQISDFPCALIAIKDGKISWQSISEPLFENGCYPDYQASPQYINVLWNNFLNGSLRSNTTSSKINCWLNTYDKHNLGNVYFEETYFGVPIMNTLLVLLTADERDL